ASPDGPFRDAVPIKAPHSKPPLSSMPNIASPFRTTYHTPNLEELPKSDILLPQGPQNGDSGRVLILCFDGTRTKFGEESNIVRFFRALKKHNREQVVYYQPGIGMLAWNLDDCIKDGYKFLIQNYQPGDKICLFGFSRGAHTARAVAGMVYKVGILSRDNPQLVDFAFNIYMTTGHQGYKLGREFKSTFAYYPSIVIDFVGVWDTVSSVGIIPQTHPYTSVDYSIKCFRHALALDERRAWFRPNVWSEATVEHEQEMDADFPITWEVEQSERDVWQYTAPERDHADVKEVWFAGSHSDVGGGSPSMRRNTNLSFIPLRWMIKECILAKTGIQFDVEYLRDELEFDFRDVKTEMRQRNMKLKELGEAYQELEKYAEESPLKALPQPFVISNRSPQTHPHGYLRDIVDIIQLLMCFWWMLEFIPTLSTYQDSQGNWIRRRMCNFGFGRYIPFYENKILVHSTFKLRIAEQGYKPHAQNWDTVKDSPMLEYVS
ncbi:hypothetical protein F5887DRAFT_979177, partial [Amanita rubescens]